MYMDIYFKDKTGKRHTLSQVDVYASDYRTVKDEKRYIIAIKPWFNIRNCLEYTMTHPSRTLVNDLDSIQKIVEEYRSDRSERFPQTRAYELGDHELNEHKAIIIKEIRKQLMEIAERHELMYNED